MFSIFNKKKGFTLVELLVVIAIISLLSSVVLTSLNSARLKARDAKRKADLDQLSKAIELFYSEAGSYPGEGCATDGSSNSNGSCTPGSGDAWYPNSGLAKTFFGHNITEFISSLPKDPVNDATYFYQYEPHCAQSNGAKDGYWLRTRLESTSNWYYVKNGVQSNDPNCSSLCHLCY